MSDQRVKVVEISTLKMEDGVEELLDSPNMQPYCRYLEALVLGADVNRAIEEIADLPLERRYVWRVASALKWGFADFDTVNVSVDRDALRPEDAGKLMELLRFRPIQFCMFLKALVGSEAMERMMNQGIAVAKENS